MEPPAAAANAAVRPHWWGTLFYVPLLYLAGWLVARPLALLAPNWRSDQVDLAGLEQGSTLRSITIRSPSLIPCWRMPLPLARM